jgi:hypothetical protein
MGYNHRMPTENLKLGEVAGDTVPPPHPTANYTRGGEMPAGTTYIPVTARRDVYCVPPRIVMGRAVHQAVCGTVMFGVDRGPVIDTAIEINHDAGTATVTTQHAPPTSPSPRADRPSPPPPPASPAPAP